jgi:dimethylhistidine N-methyltransferase
MAIHGSKTGEVTKLTDHFKHEVLQGLQRTPKRLHPKFFYDERGSELFERICATNEYYPTRTETQILRQYVDEISNSLGPDCLLFEFGSGSSTKTKILLDRIGDLAAYLPIDISGPFLMRASERLRINYPRLTIIPVCADFTGPIILPELMIPPARTRAGFLPGSTIGNFIPEDACRFLSHIAELLGAGGQLLIGVDLVKDTQVLEAAYNDSEGVTAQFNLNVLHRIRSELNAKLEPTDFEHRAFFNENESRIEMHLLSRKEQALEIDGQVIHFRANESIHTENSYKYTPERFDELASHAGFEVMKLWTDPHQYFGVFLLKAVAVAPVIQHFARLPMAKNHIPEKFVQMLRHSPEGEVEHRLIQE